MDPNAFLIAIIAVIGIKALAPIIVIFACLFVLWIFT